MVKMQIVNISVIERKGYIMQTSKNICAHGDNFYFIWISICYQLVQYLIFGFEKNDPTL